MAALFARILFLSRYALDLFLAMIQLATGRFLPALHVKAVDLTGKNVIITGANSGIGLSIATVLARQGATVYLACRSISRGEEAARQIVGTQEELQKRVHVLELDTSSLASVRAFASAWMKRSDGMIDRLIHNAGIAGPPPGQNISKDGLGMIYATNFLGSFLLTSLLESSLSNDARVIFTSSTGQYGGDPRKMLSNPGLVPTSVDGKKTKDSGFYSITKSMQVIFAKLLQQRWNAKSSKSQRIAHAFSPGYTYTPIFGKMSALPPAVDPLFWILKTATLLSTPVDVGAATGVWLATTSEPEVTDRRRGGGYWDRCTRRLARADAYEEFNGIKALEQLWPMWCKDSGAQWE